MKATPMNELAKIMQALTFDEQQNIVSRIMEMLSVSINKVDTEKCSDMVNQSLNGKPDCPHCRAKADQGFINKRGFKKRAQRYFCKKCKTHFMATTNTAFAYTRKSADTWRKFIELTLSGASLKKCSIECKIAFQTAFTWRHKILNVFAVNQKSTNLTGVVEMDEMLIPISYKGNHLKGKFGKRSYLDGLFESNMPRRSYRRGTDNKPKSEKERMCVLCMIEDKNKTFFTAVPDVGLMKKHMLDATVAKHVEKGKALLLVDEGTHTKQYLAANGYNFITLASNTTDNRNDHKVEIKDGYHIQHVNAMHRHIRRFLSTYCGVSSKYLHNYISLFVWLKTVKSNSNRQLQKHSIKRATYSDCYITQKELKAFPAVPSCA